MPDQADGRMVEDCSLPKIASLYSVLVLPASHLCENADISHRLYKLLYICNVLKHLFE